MPRPRSCVTSSHPGSDRTAKVGRCLPRYFSKDCICVPRRGGVGMRGFVRILLTIVGTVCLLAASGVPSLADEGGNLTDFSSMAPVTGTAVGTVNDRGIKGGGLPWAITSGTGTVSQKGKVDVTVTGLVIPVLGNKNPVASFKAI